MNKKALKKGCHPRMFLSGISHTGYINEGKSLFTNNTKAGDSRQRLSGMTALFNNGFTLIELLVVVLIIGILSAIALSQYQKAVEKARIAEAVVMLRAIAQAHQVYYLANGEYVGPDDLDKLDIQVPGKAAARASKRIQTKDFVYAANGCGSSCSDPRYLANYLALASRVDANNTELYRLYIGRNNPNHISCSVVSANLPIAQQQLCNQIKTTGTL